MPNLSFQLIIPRFVSSNIDNDNVWLGNFCCSCRIPHLASTDCMAVYAERYSPITVSYAKLVVSTENTSFSHFHLLEYVGVRNNSRWCHHHIGHCAARRLMCLVSSHPLCTPTFTRPKMRFWGGCIHGVNSVSNIDNDNFWLGNFCCSCRLPHVASTDCMAVHAERYSLTTVSYAKLVISTENTSFRQFIYR